MGLQVTPAVIVKTAWQICGVPMISSVVVSFHMNGGTKHHDLVSRYFFLTCLHQVDELYFFSATWTIFAILRVTVT